MEGMSAPSTGTPATAPTRKGSKAALQEVASFANNLRKSSFCLWSKIQKIKTGGKPRERVEGGARQSLTILGAGGRLRRRMTEPAGRPFSVHVPPWGWALEGGAGAGEAVLSRWSPQINATSPPPAGRPLSWFSGKQKRREGDRILGRSQKRPGRESLPSRRPPRLSCGRGSAPQKG